MQERIIALRSKHTHLEEAIRIESARPMPDFFVLNELKKKKLLLKEEIANLAQQTDAA